MQLGLLSSRILAPIYRGLEPEPAQVSGIVGGGVRRILCTGTVCSMVVASLVSILIKKEVEGSLNGIWSFRHLTNTLAPKFF